MKKMFVVNGEEFKIGNVYSKSDSKKFKKVDDFDDAVWQLTSKKNTIVMVEELTDERPIRYKIVEELDYKKIFNSDEISSIKKLAYFNQIRDIDYDKYKVIYDEAIEFINNCKDLDFSLYVLSTFKSSNLDIYVKHLENIIDNDSTGKYLKDITNLPYSAEHYGESIVNKLIEVTKSTCDLYNLMQFILNLSRCKNSSLNREIDFYEILNLIDKYDKKGCYYVMLSQALPIFELNHIQTKLITLAKANNDCAYCIKFLNEIRFNGKFNYYKTLRFNDLVDTIVTYWNEDIKTYFLNDEMMKFISKENLLKLMDKCDDEYRETINYFLAVNTNI